MPPKDMDISKVQIFLDGKQLPVGFTVGKISLPEVEPGIMLEADMKAFEYMKQLKEATFTAESMHPLKRRAMMIFLIRGNDLYMRHPRKLRRKRRWV